MRPKLLIATKNPGKLREYRLLLKGLPFSIVFPERVGINTIPAETGKTFEENARLKARTLAEKCHLLTLADDSGLEVDALGGEPGVLSARYAGEKATDPERVNYLLARLKDVPENKRTARFVCFIAITRPDDGTEVCSGKCSGFITLEPRGKHGFGYDPVFYIPELGKTMAELPHEIKNRISHRGQAARKARRLLWKIAKEQKE